MRRSSTRQTHPSTYKQAAYDQSFPRAERLQPVRNPCPTPDPGHANQPARFPVEVDIQLEVANSSIKLIGEGRKMVRPEAADQGNLCPLMVRVVRANHLDQGEKVPGSPSGGRAGGDGTFFSTITA